MCTIQKSPVATINDEALIEKPSSTAAAMMIPAATPTSDVARRIPHRGKHVRMLQAVPGP